MHEALVQPGTAVYSNKMTVSRANGVHNIRAGGFHLLDFSKGEGISPER